MTFVLKDFVPYTKENYLLACRPNQFFNELEAKGNYSRNALRTAYYRAKKQGLVNETDNYIKLTLKGQQALEPFVAKRLGRNAKLIVMFDIPEEDSAKRHKLRYTLKAWGFEQVQKSVWMSDKDYRKLLKELVKELNLKGCIEIHESLRIYP